MFRKYVLSILLGFAFCLYGQDEAPLKILAIGNSFSVDALEQDLHDIVSDAGKEIVIGNLYIGGCSIDRHFKNLTDDIADYSYRKIGVDGVVDTIPNCTLTLAIADEEWDFITFQQASHDSGEYHTFSNLPALIAGVRELAGPKPVFLWHMTWAYSPDSSHDGFKRYGNDQAAMYRAIVECAKRALQDNPELKGVIPVGTAIQDARTSSLGPDLTRDGYHLDLQTGRYIAACTWFDALFAAKSEYTAYDPVKLSQEQIRLCRLAADTAVRHPFEVISIR